MALIRLRVCAGWSEPLLVAHTTLLEISCRGTIIISVIFRMNTVEQNITFIAVESVAVQLPPNLVSWESVKKHKYHRW